MVIHGLPILAQVTYYHLDGFLDSHLQRANAFRLEFSLEPFRKAVNSMYFDNSRFTCEINDVNDPKVCSRVRL